MKIASRVFSVTGLAGVAAVAVVGTYWAFLRGGLDFAVFYQSWHLVVTGHGAEIYRDSPDRYLYAPGFAWLLAPLGFLPQKTALAIWCLAKAAAFGAIVNMLSSEMTARLKGSWLAAGLAAWGALIVAKPVLIDFQYGQVNLFIVAACVWALLGHFDSRKPSSIDALRWGVVAVAALAKIFPLAVLLVPWVVTTRIPRERLKLERLGMILGLLLMMILPILAQGFSGTWELLLDWQQALQSRGLPLESHNQSFTALLHHYFSGQPTSVRAVGGPVQLGTSWMSAETINLLSFAWTFGTMGLVLGWILGGVTYGPLPWLAVLIGLLIVPSHLIWKPYFVMSLPLAILAAFQAHRAWVKSGTRWRAIVLALIGVGMNFTGFDFVGIGPGARFEAASFMLILHLALMGLVLTRTDKSAAI